jgi:hypothetical protein
MTDREAFEVWHAEWHARVSAREPSATEAWFAACAWQRERDALLCESLGTATNGIYERNQECADKIRSGE